MTYFRVTLNEDFDQVSLPNGILMTGGQSANLVAKHFFMIPEDRLDVLFSDITEHGGGSGDSGMRPEDLNAEAPLVWDAETTTLTIQMSAVGEDLLNASDAAAARSAIGAGTSNLTLGTTASTAKAGNYQPTAADISDATATGRSVLTAADATSARTAIGAGTGNSNLALGTTSTTAKAGDYQPTSADISDSSAVGRSVLTAADEAAARTAIGAGTSNLAVGTGAADAKAGNYQPAAADISDATTVGQNVLTAADAAAARTAIGAGTGNSNLALGTTSTTAKAGDYQPSASDITDASAVGQSVLTAADAGTARTAIGAGTSSLTIGTGASNAAAGDHTHTQYLVATQAAAVADASGDAEAQLNALLASLRAAGVLAE